MKVASRAGVSPKDVDNPTGSGGPMGRTLRAAAAGWASHRRGSTAGQYHRRVLAAEPEGIHLEHLDVNRSRLVKDDVEAHGRIEVGGARHVREAAAAHGVDAGDEGHRPCGRA